MMISLAGRVGARATLPILRVLAYIVPGSTMLLAGCGDPPAAEVRALPVRTMRIGADTSTLAGGVSYAGVIVARTEAAVAFQVPGRIVARLVDVGQPVASGTPLARLDASDFTLNAESARASLRAADADAQTAAADLARARELHQQRILADAAMERAVALAATAASRRDDARARLAAAENAVRYATLIASEAGVVTAVMGEVGQVVAPGQPVVTIAREGAREVAIDVPEGRVASLRRGERARVSLIAADDASAAMALSATVREVAPAADPVTGTYRIRLALSASAAAAPQLGRSAVVVFEAPRQAGLVTIPSAALVRTADVAGVWVLGPKRDRLRFQAVEIARLGDGEVVLRSGLRSGDEIVSAGANRLDSAVVVKPWKGRLP